MDYEVRISRYGSGSLIGAHYYYQFDTVLLESGSELPGYEQPIIEDLLSHEILHHVLDKLCDEETARRMDNMCYEERISPDWQRRRWVPKCGLTFEHWP